MTPSLPRSSSVASESDLKIYVDVLAGVKDTEQLALLLFVQGYRGIPYEADSCPIASYLSDNTGKPVLVGGDAAYITEEGISASLSPILTQFIHEFDSGSHKELRLPLTKRVYKKLISFLTTKRHKVFY